MRLPLAELRKLTPDQWRAIAVEGKRALRSLQRIRTQGKEQNAGLMRTAKVAGAAGLTGYLWVKKGPDYRPVANLPFELLSAVALHGAAWYGLGGRHNAVHMKDLG